MDSHICTNTFSNIIICTGEGGLYFVPNYAQKQFAGRSFDPKSNLRPNNIILINSFLCFQTFIYQYKT